MTNIIPTWKRNHDAAMTAPRPGFEAAFVGMYLAWQNYRNNHESEYEALIGDDHVLGPEWAAIGRALLGLLNGDTGRLDCGTLDAEIRAVLAGAGCEADE